ncbi:MAG: hypothetical protein RIF37_01615 [Rhodospirillaceae bacterium]
MTRRILLGVVLGLCLGQPARQPVTTPPKGAAHGIQDVMMTAP